jgi:DNA-binding transcriptional LysR family regulator
MGLGYAWYPEESIREELESRRLVPLPLEEGRERYVTLYLVYADRDTAGPGVRQLAGIIQKRTAETCAAADRRLVSLSSPGTTA